ncbi:unnamed protein product, partial [Amoebophrya sp. A25]|eukprot:GSA25T00005510001.1
MIMGHHAFASPEEDVHKIECLFVPVIIRFVTFGLLIWASHTHTDRLYLLNPAIL